MAINLVVKNVSPFPSISNLIHFKLVLTRAAMPGWNLCAHPEPSRNGTSTTPHQQFHAPTIDHISLSTDNWLRNPSAHKILTELTYMSIKGSCGVVVKSTAFETGGHRFEFCLGQGHRLEKTKKKNLLVPAWGGTSALGDLETALSCGYSSSGQVPWSGSSPTNKQTNKQTNKKTYDSIFELHPLFSILTNPILIIWT